MIFQKNITQKRSWLQFFGILTLLLFSLSSCQEEKIIVPEKAGVSVEEFTDAVIADEHFQSTLTIISNGLDSKLDESAIEHQLKELFTDEKTDYLRSMFEKIPVNGSKEEHTNAVFTQLNEKIDAEFEELFVGAAGSNSTIGLGDKDTPCFDRLTNDRASISITTVLCTGAAVAQGSLEAAWGCQVIASIQIAGAYARFHRCLETNY